MSQNKCPTFFQYTLGLQGTGHWKCLIPDLSKIKLSKMDQTEKNKFKAKKRNK